MTNNTKTIIQNAESMLKTAKHGFQLLSLKDPNVRNMLPTAVRNVLVFGRSVTNVLQKLRRRETDFEEWYAKYVQEMENDPLLKYLYDLRSEVLKEGSLPIASSARVVFYTEWLKKIPRPPHATEFFMGDRLGGSGWLIELPDGTTEKFYIALPEEWIISSVHFTNMPKKHLGIDISDYTIKEVCESYLYYLEGMLKEAREKFIN